MGIVVKLSRPGIGVKKENLVQAMSELDSTRRVHPPPPKCQKTISRAKHDVDCDKHNASLYPAIFSGKGG